MKHRLLIIALVNAVLAILLLTTPLWVDGARSRCSDFHYQQDAQAALQRGDHWLDGDGDNRACENLPIKDNSVSMTLLIITIAIVFSLFGAITERLFGWLGWWEYHLLCRPSKYMIAKIQRLKFLR